MRFGAGKMKIEKAWILYGYNNVPVVVVYASTFKIASKLATKYLKEHYPECPIGLCALSDLPAVSDQGVPLNPVGEEDFGDPTAVDEAIADENKWSRGWFKKPLNQETIWEIFDNDTPDFSDVWLRGDPIGLRIEFIGNRGKYLGFTTLSVLRTFDKTHKEIIIELSKHRKSDVKFPVY